MISPKFQRGSSTRRCPQALPETLDQPSSEEWRPAFEKGIPFIQGLHSKQTRLPYPRPVLAAPHLTQEQAAKPIVEAEAIAEARHSGLTALA